VQATGYNDYGYVYVSLGWTNQFRPPLRTSSSAKTPATGVFAVIGNTAATWANDADLADGATLTYEIVAEDRPGRCPPRPIQ